MFAKLNKPVTVPEVFNMLNEFTKPNKSRAIKVCACLAVALA